jgi:hypothetical protein
MRASGGRRLPSAQRLFVVIGLLVVLALSGAFYITATRYEAHAPPYHGEVQPGTPTPAPPRGRRWFFMRPFWLPQPGAQP